MMALSSAVFSAVIAQSNCAKHSSGDADCNGSIDLLDFEIFRGEFIAQGKGQLDINSAKSDFNTDRSVDLLDFEIFRRGYISGPTSTPISTATQIPTITTTVTRIPTSQPTPTNTAGGPFLPYSENSFFKKPLPSNAPVDSDSAAGINFVKNHPDNKNYAYPVIKGLDGNNWGTPYLEGNCSDPIWKLTGSVSNAPFLQTEGFHAPESLSNILTGTSDSPFVVLDRCGVPSMPKGLTVMGTAASRSGTHTINIGSSVGAFQHDSNGLDQRDPKSDSSKNASSRGRIPDSMVIRKDRLEWAIQNNTDLGYVLHMFWVETRTSDGYVHPMAGAESSKVGWGPEGIRIRIKASVDLTKRGLSPGGLVIARTLQNHGAYLGDNAGSMTSLKAEQNFGQWGTLINPDSLKGVTWDDFEFVQRGYEP